jgi:hypothetical protein
VLTIFCSPKPFTGETTWNQLNALRSWRGIHPDLEIIIFGSPSGAAEAAAEVSATLVPDIQTSPSGAPSFNAMVAYVSAHGRHDMLVYANCDILLNATLLKAMLNVRKRLTRFLLIGECMDLSQGSILDARDANWTYCLQSFAESGSLSVRGPAAVDYFGFRKNMWEHLPPVFMGRSLCDQALLHYCFRNGIPVVDASRVTMALHQFHKYSHVCGGLQEVSSGEDWANMRRAHGLYHSVPTIADADLSFSEDGDIIPARCRGSLLRQMELVLRYKFGLNRVSFILRGLQYLRGKSAVIRNTMSTEVLLNSWKRSMSSLTE